MNIITKEAEHAFYSEIEKVAMSKKLMGAVISKRGSRFLKALSGTVPKGNKEIEAIQGVWHNLMSPDLIQHVPDKLLRKGVNLSGDVLRKVKGAAETTGKLSKGLETVQDISRKVGNVANVATKPVKTTEGIIRQYAGPSKESVKRQAKDMGYNLGVLGARRQKGY